MDVLIFLLCMVACAFWEVFVVGRYFARQKPRECRHLFIGKDLRPRDKNGIVRWPCCKCKKVFEAECGLDILKNGRCIGIWF